MANRTEQDPAEMGSGAVVGRLAQTPRRDRHPRGRGSDRRSRRCRRGGADHRRGARESVPGDEGRKPSRRGPVRQWDWDQLFVDFVAAGYDGAEFWGLTPRELDRYMRAARKRLEREHDANAWLAWHIAGMVRAKKMPKLESLLSRKSGRPRRQSVAEQLHLLEQWAARQRLAQRLIEGNGDGR